MDLTGGWNGLSGIPSPTIFGAEIGEEGHRIPLPWR